MSHDVVHAPHRPRHDRPTLVNYGALAMWSWFVYGLGASLALLGDEQHSSSWLHGLHGTSLAIGGVIGALLAPTFNNRFGRGAVVRAGVLGSAACIALFLLPSTPVAWTLGWVFVATLFGNLIVVGVNAFIAAHQGVAAPAAFTESTGLAALAGLLSPLAVGLAAATAMGWRWGLLVGVAGFVLVEIWRGRDLAPYGAPGMVRTRRAAGGLPPLTWWALFAGMFYIGAEFCLSLWGASFIHERAGLSDAASAAGLSTILAGLFVGRAFGVRIAERVPSELLLRMSMLGGLFAFAIAWLVTNPVALLGALFLTGLCLSLTWPLSMARILRAAGGRDDRAASLALVFTTTAIGVAPFLLGGLASNMPVHSAFLLVPVLLVTALVLVVLRPIPEPA